jgi:choline dehydrogenase
VAAGHAAAFIRTRPESKRPDAQIYFINFSSLKRGGLLHPHSGFTSAVSQLQVESRGSVHIRSADPAAPPSIRYNYLASENDRRVMVEGLKFIRRLCATPPMKDYVAGESRREIACRPMANGSTIAARWAKRFSIPRPLAAWGRWSTKN